LNPRCWPIDRKNPIISVPFFEKEFQFPPTQEPLWKSDCERWQFLDKASFSFAQAIFETVLNPKPEIFYLCSQEGSNQTDFDFVNSGYLSPAKFVHTLPNVRVSSFFQVSKLKGEVLCFSNGAYSLSYALNEALHRFAFDRKPSVLMALQNNTVLLGSVSEIAVTHESFVAQRQDSAILPTDVHFLLGLKAQSFSVLDWSLTRK